MKAFLNGIREPKAGSAASGIVRSLLVLALGLALGVGAKLLDLVPAENGGFLQNLITRFDLGNFFSALPVWLLAGLIVAVYSRSALRAALNTFLFFLGLCVSYHIASIRLAHFDPSAYMKTWYAVCALSAPMGFVAWYSKGKGAAALIISVLILGVMACHCFPAGFWYYDVKIPGAVLFLASAAVIRKSFKRSLITIPAGLLLGFLMASAAPLG